MENKAITTERQIGKITYIIVAAPSDDAQERLEAKINRLLQKNIRQYAEND